MAPILEQKTGWTQLILGITPSISPLKLGIVQFIYTGLAIVQYNEVAYATEMENLKHQNGLLPDSSKTVEGLAIYSPAVIAGCAF